MEPTYSGTRRSLVGTVGLAAAGVGLGGTAVRGDSPHRLVVDGDGSRTDYEFTVSGEVLGGEDLSGPDSYAGSAASGAVVEWSDAYTFTGDLATLAVDGDATVRVDGETVDPADFGDGDRDDGGSGGGGSRAFDERVERAIHERVNEARTDRGLSPFDWGGTLAEVADAHSADMAENDYFSHTGPDGEGPGDRYDEAGLSCRGWAENVAYNYAGDRDAESAADRTVEQWMNSAGHRRNVLSEEFESEGIGVAVTDGRLYATQNFGTDCS